jgi:glycosyltransferase involved in cell wall biosynthesis
MERVIVLGAVRNCEASLDKTVESISNALGHEADIHWVIVESDSRDRSVEKLKFLSGEITNFSFESLGNVRHRIPDWVERIRHARTRGSELSRSKDIAGVSWLVVADFDGVNDSLAKGAIVDAISAYPGFQGYFANSHSAYYDILALWAFGWVEEHYPSTEKADVDSGVSPISAKWNALFSKQITISGLSEPIVVDSAFGGLGIYEWSAALRASYCDVRFARECEHVSFNSTLSKGSKLAIIPSLRNKPELKHIILAIGLGRAFVNVMRKPPAAWQRTKIATVSFFLRK